MQTPLFRGEGKQHIAGQGCVPADQRLVSHGCCFLKQGASQISTALVLLWLHQIPRWMQTFPMSLFSPSVRSDSPGMLGWVLQSCSHQLCLCPRLWSFHWVLISQQDKEWQLQKGHGNARESFLRRSKPCNYGVQLLIGINTFETNSVLCLDVSKFVQDMQNYFGCIFFYPVRSLIISQLFFISVLYGRVGRG